MRITKNRGRVATVGLTSLFAVLITLCLLIFAVLARLTAESELMLARRAADTISARYAQQYREIVGDYEEGDTQSREGEPVQTASPPSLFDPDRMPWEN